MHRLQMKCVQLDLARQIESVDYIKQFIDMVSTCGYDSILLYLEDRVRTASYPYPAEGQAYSPDEIREIVSHAREKNIDLIPCVATLGHAERFLEHEALAHLSEVQGDSKNRFGVSCGLKDVFCMNHEDFYPFMEQYIREVAELFPGSYFHAGLDEFFDFNLCERCKEKMTTFQQEEDAFLAHIVRINDLLLSLGKRMMMWSDMFEIYTTVMERIPKNIIMVDWQYQEDVRFYLHHLLNQASEPRQKNNDKLGLTAIAASADRDLSNVTSTIKYALRNKVWGYLMTSWEKTDVYLYRTYPVICYGGFLLSGKSDKEAWLLSMEYLFGSQDPLLSKVVRMISTDFNMRHFEEISESNIFTRSYWGLHGNDADQCAVMQSMLEQAKDQVKTDLGKRVWKDLWNVLEEKLVAAELKSAAWDLADYGQEDEADFVRLAETEKRFHALFESKTADWATFRTGVEDTVFAPAKEKQFNNLHERIQRLKKNYYLMVRFCMPDQYGVNFIRIEALCSGKWIEAVPANGCKNSNVHEGLFERMFPVDLPCAPEKLRISVNGMGGRGICFVQLRDRVNNCRYVPQAVTETEGIVEHASHLLTDDTKFAYFNNQCTRYNYINNKAAEVFHTVTLEMVRE